MLETLLDSFSTKWLFDDKHVYAFDCESHSHKFIVYYDGSGFSLKPNVTLKALLDERYAYGSTLSVEFSVEEHTLSFPFSDSRMERTLYFNLSKTASSMMPLLSTKFLRREYFSIVCR